MNAPCPTCGADAYRLCVDRNGQPMPVDYHPARRGETPLLALAKLAAANLAVMTFRGSCPVCFVAEGHRLSCSLALALRVIDETGLSPMELIDAHDNPSTTPLSATSAPGSQL